MKKPAYLKLYDSGELSKRAEEATSFLSPCRVCPRKCGVDRLAGEVGSCQVGAKLKISSAVAHSGEEPPISGRRGSGTIFFTYCNLHCIYCQNFDISQLGHGEVVTENELARQMLRLQAQGVHNINWVSPSHYVPQILRALAIACQKGLNLPIVYNSGGYDSVEILRLLNGVVDIYMPDMKYGDNQTALHLSDVGDYVEKNHAALREMQNQVGDLKLDEEGVAQRGLLVRHLVLPFNLSGTDTCLKYLAQEISPDVYLSLMAQYHPCHKASAHSKLNRFITRKEYEQAKEWAEQFGIHRGYFQELSSSNSFLPNFDKENPFK